MSGIAVIGTGYVGLTTAVCLAELGHQVTGVDTDTTKVAALRQGAPTIFEPGLAELMAKSVKAERLRFTTDYAEAIPQADFVSLPSGRRPVGVARPTSSTSSRRPSRSRRR